MWYAHSTNLADRSDWEPLRDHLRHVGDRARSFAARFGAGEFGEVLGLLHDLGKYDPNFLRRLEGEGLRHEHSTAGAVIASRRYGPIGKLLAYAVAGHHAGLADGVRDERGDIQRRSLAERLGDAKSIEQAEAALARAQADGLALPAGLNGVPLQGERQHPGFDIAFFGRMLFSCLVDADYLATESFYVQTCRSSAERAGFPDVAALRETLDAYLAGEIAPKADRSALNRLRSDILSHARALADRPPGVFTLTVPTGGGKTLTSLAFALDHAVRHGLDRIVYVIPFTSIIEQTADVFRTALAPHADAVLEHHSAFDEMKLREDDTRDKLRLAAENWDAPLIVTTAVQFFESLFSDRPSRCRKLHHLARSVIVLDEAQTLPVSLLRPCVAALGELVRRYGASLVLCTATQPVLHENPAEKDRSFKGGLPKGVELAPDPSRLFENLRRATITHAGTLADDALAERLAQAEQVLCIVNTRTHAQDLYRILAGRSGTYHLSTLMCAAHRREILAEIRQRLKDGAPCRVVSTSLIEAGVDIDFPLVYRAQAGLDSIAQAAGRCNREGLRPVDRSPTVVFDVADEKHVLKSLNLYADVARGFLRRGRDPRTPEVMEEYFREVYWLKGNDELDRPGILRRCAEGGRRLDLPFASVAQDFRMIDSVFAPIIVPWGDARALVEELRRMAALPEPVPVGRLARKLQPYAVGIPEQIRARLVATAAASVVGGSRFGDQFVWLENADLYRPDVGLVWEDPTFREAGSLIC
ncbi:CRISPR-associated endonuclease Cas3'' [Microvirga thermotolerans]|uniref:CRISPR-associated endonuclease Cas3 n=2 Tax=Microvirga thermotolerans TaxID=2651334 RepID=A0A5P9JZK2_9HYPH|nr:CRISPR-associated endonuclease Cas3'' [Microvirga thermotolerans]